VGIALFTKTSSYLSFYDIDETADWSNTCRLTWIMNKEMRSQEEKEPEIY